MSEPNLARSYLYVPGNAEDKLSKAMTRGADALIVDLEDAVPVSEKDRARASVAAWLAELPTNVDTEVWVRVNPGDLLVTDVRALAGIPALRGIALAKCESPADVIRAEAVLSALSDTTTKIMPLIETPGALLAAEEIARCARVHQLQIGEVDLAAELGVTVDSNGTELAPYRAMVVLASMAAGIQPPVGAVSTITADLARLTESTEILKRQGFVGRACIHPAQIAVVHGCFAPTPEEIADAEEVVAVFEKAAERGSGVALDSSGRLIDLAVLRGARRILALVR